MLLDSSVRFILLRFNFSNPRIAPLSAWEKPRETEQEARQRRQRNASGGGTMFLPRIQRCFAFEFLDGLEAAGYVLVDASNQERLKENPSWPRSGPQSLVYNTLSIVLVRHKYLREGFLPACEGNLELKIDLLDFIDTAFWAVEGYDNPFYENGNPLPGQRALTLNFAGRVPLFSPDSWNGEPITAWRKDEAGKRIGDEPVLLQPDYNLRVVDGAIVAVPAY